MKIGFYVLCVAVLAGYEVQDPIEGATPQPVEPVEQEINEQKIRTSGRLFEIAGTRLFMSDNDVRSTLGKPLSIESIPFYCLQGETCEDWKYEKASLFLYNGEVNGVDSASPSLCLWGELCPGDPIEKAIALLGQTQLWPASSDKPARLEYFDKNRAAACWLWVYLSENKKNDFTLRLACQP